MSNDQELVFIKFIKAHFGVTLVVSFEVFP
jgi:hypothetical protein